MGGWMKRGLMIATVALALPAAAAAQALTGTWIAREGSDDRGPNVRLLLDRHDGNWGNGLRVEDAEALWREVSRGGEMEWTLTAPAGRIVFEGELRSGRGLGEFSFYPDNGFEARMADEGIRGSLDDEEHLAAAIFRISPESARDLRQAGFARLDFDDLMAAAIFRVDREFVEAMRDHDLDGDLDEFVAFKIHGVTPEFAGAARSWGMGRLDGDDLLAFRIHGVTQEFVTSMTSSGMGRISGDDLLAARIHGVSPEFAREVRDWDLGEPDFDELVALRIHGVTNGFIEDMDDVGIRPESLDQAIAFRIHNVTAALVRELREDGLDDLTADDLISIRIHGLDRILRRRRRGGGGSG